MLLQLLVAVLRLSIVLAQFGATLDQPVNVLVAAELGKVWCLDCVLWVCRLMRKQVLDCFEWLCGSEYRSQRKIIDLLRLLIGGCTARTDGDRTTFECVWHALGLEWVQEDAETDRWSLNFSLCVESYASSPFSCCFNIHHHTCMPTHGPHSTANQPLLIILQAQVLYSNVHKPTCHHTQAKTHLC